jgi:hypothetical protein
VWFYFAGDYGIARISGVTATAASGTEFVFLFFVHMFVFV